MSIKIHVFDIWLGHPNQRIKKRVEMAIIGNNYGHPLHTATILGAELLMRDYYCIHKFKTFKSAMDFAIKYGKNLDQKMRVSREGVILKQGTA